MDLVEKVGDVVGRFMQEPTTAALTSRTYLTVTENVVVSVIVPISKTFTQ